MSKSSCHNFFKMEDGGRRRKCILCDQSYSISTSMGNLRSHLMTKHPEIDTSAISQPRQKPQQMDYDHLNWLIMKGLIISSLPPSTMEEEWLANSYQFLKPSFKIWPAEKYKAVLREVFSSTLEDVKASSERVSSRISLTLHFWNSFEQTSCMSITCHWIDESWSFQKVLLDISHIPYSCGGAQIFHSLVKVLQKFNIEKKIISCTHDLSHQEATHACHALKAHLDGLNIRTFDCIPCAACTLNLMIDDGLGTAKSIIAKVREFVLELNACLDMSKDFVQFTTVNEEGSWRFPLDASARWSGNYQILDLVCKAEKSMEAVIRKYEETLGSKMLLNSVEKNTANIVHQYLDAFHRTTNNICTSKVPTVGLVLLYMDHICETITACRDSRHNPDWLKSAAEDMAEKAKHYSHLVCNTFTYITAILDPRIKGDLIPESLKSENHLEEAKSHFMRYYSSNHFPSMTAGHTAQEIEEGGSVSFIEEIAKKKRRASINNAPDELTKYLSEPFALRPREDALEWWKDHSTHYPRLSVMARDFLAVQATSLTPEEMFSWRGDEVNKQKYCMPRDTTSSVLPSSH